MSEAPEASPGTTARRHFHWCLAAAILPVVSLPFEWFVAYRDQRAVDPTPDHRRWSRWLIGLAAVDTIVAAFVIALVASGVWGSHTLTQSRSPAAGWRRHRRSPASVVLPSRGLARPLPLTARS